MKWVVGLVLVFCWFSFPGWAQETAAPETLKGTIVDNHCADAGKGNLADLAKNHTKECNLMPCCAASGYAIITDGKLLKFDQENKAKIGEFLKKPESTVQVTVKAKPVKDGLSLVSIENQQ